MIVFNGGNEKDFTSYFTIYHFLAGVIVGYLKLPLIYWFLLHIIFEIVENILIRIPQTGTLIRKIENTYMNILNKITGIFGFIVDVPPYNGDSLENSIGDTVFAVAGWIIGDILVSQ